MTFRGFEVRRVDYITRPISPPIVLARVRTQLALEAAADFLRDKNESLAAEVGRLTWQIPIVQDVSIMAMALLAETRDHETGNPPYAALLAGAGARAAEAPEVCRRPGRPGRRPAVQVGPAARHRQGRDTGRDPAESPASSRMAAARQVARVLGLRESNENLLRVLPLGRAGRTDHTLATETNAGRAGWSESNQSRICRIHRRHYGIPRPVWRMYA
jgi:hypothetical protein